MTELEYRLTNDILFKMLFVKNPGLLESLVAELLGIPQGSIGELVVTNSEMTAEIVGSKFCRLDINMTVDGRHVNLEIQVKDEGNYPERTLFNWARVYSAALKSGNDYSMLPRTVVVSIVGFRLFGCAEYHSEYQALEVTRHTPLSDRLCLHYFELSKLPEEIDGDNLLELWLGLFKAKTEEELAKIEALEVPVMKQAIEAYKTVSASPEFLELERMRAKARNDEAQALHNARLEESKRWLAVVENKDIELADKDAAIAGKDAAIADKDALIAELRARLGEE